MNTNAKIALPFDLDKSKLNVDARMFINSGNASEAKVVDTYHDYNAISEHVRRLNNIIALNELLGIY